MVSAHWCRSQRVFIFVAVIRHKTLRLRKRHRSAWHQVWHVGDVRPRELVLQAILCGTHSSEAVLLLQVLADDIAMSRPVLDKLPVRNAHPLRQFLVAVQTNTNTVGQHVTYALQPLDSLTGRDQIPTLLLPSRATERAGGVMVAKPLDGTIRVERVATLEAYGCGGFERLHADRAIFHGHERKLRLPLPTLVARRAAWGLAHSPTILIIRCRVRGRFTRITRVTVMTTKYRTHTFSTFRPARNGVK